MKQLKEYTFIYRVKGALLMNRARKRVKRSLKIEICDYRKTRDLHVDKSVQCSNCTKFEGSNLTRMWNMISSPATPTVCLEQKSETFQSRNVTLSMPSQSKKKCIWDNLHCCLLVPRSPSKPVMLTFWPAISKSVIHWDHLLACIT